MSVEINFDVSSEDEETSSFDNQNNNIDGISDENDSKPSCFFCGFNDPDLLVKYKNRWFCNGDGQFSHIGFAINFYERENMAVVEFHKSNQFHEIEIECECGNKNIRLLKILIDSNGFYFVCNDCRPPGRKEGIYDLCSSIGIHPKILGYIPDTYRDIFGRFSEEYCEERLSNDRVLNNPIFREFPDYDKYILSEIEECRIYEKSKCEEYKEKCKVARCGVPDVIKLQLDRVSPQITFSTLFRLSHGMSTYHLYVNSESYIDDRNELKNHVIYLSTKDCQKGALQDGALVNVSIVFDESVYSKMKSAVLLVKTDQYLRDLLIGNRKDLCRIADGPRIMEESLNESQREALNKCMYNRLTIIHGPPGTGKSFFISKLTKHVLRFERSKESKRVLILCRNYAACEVILDYLRKEFGDDTERIVTFSPSTAYECFYMDSRESLSYKVQKRLNNIEGYKNMSTDERDRISIKIREEVMLSTEVFVTVLLRFNSWVSESQSFSNDNKTATLNADHHKLDSKSFTVILDESSQLLESETLLPLSLLAKRYVLVGDHKQIGAKFAGRDGRSLFERLIEYNSNIVSVFDIQYRMHPQLMEFPSQAFYNGRVRSFMDKNFDRNVYDWPNREYPICLIKTSGTQARALVKSSKNEEEANAVATIYNTLVSNGVDPNRISIITPYNGQKNLITTIIRDSTTEHGRPKIDTVDSFQGSENDYIIYSLVSRGSRFTTDDRRFNVSITRQKRGLFFVYSEFTDSSRRRASSIESFISFAERHKLVQD